MFQASQTEDTTAFVEIIIQENKTNLFRLLYPHGSLKPEHMNIWFWSFIHVRVCKPYLMQERMTPFFQ